MLTPDVISDLTLGICIHVWFPWQVCLYPHCRAVIEWISLVGNPTAKVGFTRQVKTVLSWGVFHCIKIRQGQHTVPLVLISAWDWDIWQRTWRRPLPFWSDSRRPQYLKWKQKVIFRQLNFASMMIADGMPGVVGSQCDCLSALYDH